VFFGSKIPKTKTEVTSFVIVLYLPGYMESHLWIDEFLYGAECCTMMRGTVNKIMFNMATACLAEEKECACVINLADLS